MKLFAITILIPVTMVAGLAFAVPGLTGFFYGVAVAVLYFMLMMARASDWR